ncbi:MAG: aminopeptidase N [Gammaproteobacteria bacterium]|nr:aminopeptidase N [Gammaproteobacteria bacterium]
MRAEPKYLVEYRSPDYRTVETHLDFDLHSTKTRVLAKLFVKRINLDPKIPIVLFGKDLELVSLLIDGSTPEEGDIEIDEEELRIWGLPLECTLIIETLINPDLNTSLEGLYKSSGMYCTQCEAEGFRKITYYQDRPDILSVFTTTITAMANEYPVLLSNGNLLEERTLPNGRHQVTWFDPFPKPSYLFALVAGDLASLEDKFITQSGRSIDLRIYSENHNIEKCHYAMATLKHAMAWDERAYGREYDLDVFMIVAVEDFNMGAMENKGLNIFNTSCVLATPDSATDAAFQRVESVVGHEYFHNWSGNRVTCRDWFQLSLKEGFTVFRDSEFSSDMNSHGLTRIQDANLLRTVQFPEDAGPMAHPVRPDSYIEISNFYTATVYEKGSEIVRMLKVILGANNFRLATDEYFRKYDGDAVTTDIFFQTMEAFVDFDISQFKLWYTEAGTPTLRWESHWQNGVFVIVIRQSRPRTSGKESPPSMYIPLRLGLLDREGNELIGPQLIYECSARARLDTDSTLLIHLTAPVTTLKVSGLSMRPTVSFLRGFSAPVRIESSVSKVDLEFLVTKDSDPFVRWDAAQGLILSEIDQMQKGQPNDETTVRLFRAFLTEAWQEVEAGDAGHRLALLASLAVLPEENYIFDQLIEFDVDAVSAAREELRHRIGTEYFSEWIGLYDLTKPNAPFSNDVNQVARRSFRNLCLHYIAAVLDGEELENLLFEQYSQADNLTDRYAVLAEVAQNGTLKAISRKSFMDDFFHRWRKEPLVIDSWFSVQAASDLSGISELKTLEKNSEFDERNPNKVRALYASFSQKNHRRFHSLDGSGYNYLGEVILRLDKLNPQVASRLLGPFTRWQRYDPVRQKLMCEVLGRIASGSSLSKDVYETVSKSLRLAE